MILSFLLDIFHVVKWLFGLGALAGLLSLGGVLLWLTGHLIVRAALRQRPAHQAALLRKLFLEDA